ncbi:MAG: hypothetical protein U9P14_04360, partial [Gemmatimonadota bacterium]|nr:hypothetical protein [Gemmatimonadota bacterium]
VTSHKDPSYVPTAPRSTDHRHFFLREESPEGEAVCWYMIPQRGREEEAYGNFRCEQGLDWLRILSEHSGVSSELMVFVPVEEPLEVWRVMLSNTTERRRKLKLFTWVNWGLESYPGYYFDPRVVGQGRRYEELNALVALNRDQNNKHPRTGFLMSRQPFDGFDMSAEDFTGGGFFSLFPQAVQQGFCTGSMGVQPCQGLIAAMQFDLELDAGQSKTCDFLLGVTDPGLEKAESHLAGLRRTFFAEGAVKEKLEEIKNRWNGLASCHMVKSPDTETDRFFNVWSKYQAKHMARFINALDKVGYRDLLQHLMGINSFNPEYTSVMLPVSLRYQYPDGRAMRQFARFPGAPHDLRMYMDSSSWIPDTLVDYLKETGDFGILERREPFFDPETGELDDKAGATVYEHALRGVKTLYENRGQFGLCRIGHGDWNDSLDGVGREGGGVSVWLSMALVYAAGKMRELAGWLEDAENMALMEKIAGEMTEAVNRSAWDGEYYIYAFNADGSPVGSRKSPEGKIHLNVNSWSLFNGVAEKQGRIERVLDSIARVSTPIGHILLDPPYTHESREVGRIADIVPGQFENGAIYTHGQSFVIYALSCLGKGDEAFAELKKVLPGATVPDITTGPLHQVSNYTVGPAHEHFGRNLYSNFSGSLAWIRKSLSRIFGVLADFDGLVIDPCVPSDWESYEVVKVFRGCRVKVRFSNPDRVCRGVVRATADGEELAIREGKAYIRLEQLSGRKELNVDVRLGRVS